MQPAPGTLVALVFLAMLAAGPALAQPSGKTPWGTPLPLGLDPSIPVPADNPMSPEKIELGRLLIFDPRLSADGTIACTNCHAPSGAGTDNLPTSMGIRGQRGDRSAPTWVNSAYVAPLFWDGRAPSLEEQAKGPQTNPIEMGNPDLESVAKRIGAIAGYRERFQKAFGSEQVTPDRIAKAIAAYERTLLSGDSPFDRFSAGDKGALTAEQQKGLELFRGKARCVICHAGPNFANNLFHNIGVGTQKPEAEVDAGRMKVTGDPKQWAAFKTPTLRNIARTAPYMHDGSEPTLEAVVEYYDRGGAPNKNLDPLIQPLGLTPAEKRALVAFLKALDGEILNDDPPASFPR
jgi:cytochrome c peroxidase